MDARSRRHLGLVALVVLVSLAGCSYAVPDVCGPPCTVAITAGHQGYDVTTEREHLTIDVRADGSARWTARLVLTGPGVSGLQANSSFVRSLALSAFEAPTFSAAPATPRNLSIRFEGRTLVVSFDDPHLGHRSIGGVVVVDRFNREPSGSFEGYDVEADSVVIRSPDGTVIANRPPNGVVRNDVVEYRDYVAKKTYLVFAPGRSAAWRGATEVAVFLEVLAWTFVPTVVGAIPGLVLLVGVGFVLLYNRWPDRDPYADLGEERWWALGSLLVLAVATVALTNRPPRLGTIDLSQWLVILSPAAVLGGLGAVGHGGPRARVVGLVGLFGVVVAGSFGTVLAAGSHLDTVFVYASIWAVVGVLVGTPLHLALRQYVTWVDAS